MTRTPVPLLPDRTDYKQVRKTQVTPKPLPATPLSLNPSKSDIPRLELETRSKVLSIAPSVQNETSKENKSPSNGDY